jgi:hypothetical protein
MTQEEADYFSGPSGQPASGGFITQGAHFNWSLRTPNLLSLFKPHPLPIPIQPAANH